MESTKKLLINIVTWNSARFLPNLFDSFDQQISQDFTVMMIDNASTDETLEWLSRNRQTAGVLRNFRNQGFARAHNQGIALGLGRWNAEELHQRYVMVANPDLEFGPAAIEQIIAFMDEHPEVSVCGPKLLRARTVAEGDDGRRETERTSIIDAMGIALTKARRVVDRGAGEEDKGQHDSETRVFGLSGACAVYRASVLQELVKQGEVFDEQFFAYQEDVDLAWRLRLQGHESYVIPTAVVWHHRHAPSAPRQGWLKAWRARSRKSPQVNFLSTRNHAWLLIKNEQSSNLLLHFPWWFPYECAKLLASLFSPNQLKAQLASLAGYPAMARKRKGLKPLGKVGPQEMRRWFV